MIKSQWSMAVTMTKDHLLFHNQVRGGCRLGFDDMTLTKLFKIIPDSIPSQRIHLCSIALIYIETNMHNIQPDTSVRATVLKFKI